MGLEDYSRQGEEGDPQKSEARCEEASLPGPRSLVTVADSGQSNLQSIISVHNYYCIVCKYYSVFCPNSGVCRFHGHSLQDYL